MRFMLLVKATADSESGVRPDPETMAAIGTYNADLAKAGVMLAGEGLLPSSAGVRVSVATDGQRRVVDGPFTEAKELIAGFWMIQVTSKDEAIEWAARIPLGQEVEVRRVFDASDFPPGVRTAEQDAAAGS
jgi:hypothetical protein